MNRTERTTMKTARLALFSLLVAAATACATPAPAGRPEAVIRGSVDVIKAAIVADMVGLGYQIEKDTPMLLELARKTQGNEDVTAYFLVGNARSTNHRVASYTFLPGPDGVRVIVASSIRAQLPAGQVNSHELTGNAEVYRAFESHLAEVKAAVERTSASK